MWHYDKQIIVQTPCQNQERERMRTLTVTQVMRKIVQCTYFIIKDLKL